MWHVFTVQKWLLKMQSKSDQHENAVLISQHVRSFLRGFFSVSIYQFHCEKTKSEGCPILSTRLQSYPLALDWKTGSVDV